ncbi:MAG: alpha/beta hydrolase [Bacillota bacterium]
MALLQVNYFSKSLRRITTFNTLLPLDTYGTPEQNETFRQPVKALYLLHGYTGNYTDWVCGSIIRELSSKYNIAVFMPSGDNFFYLDDTDMGALYSEFVGNELVEFTRKMFPLSGNREDTFIGGLSMGGYGAIRNGLKYSHNFSRIIALSSALITYKIAGIKPGFKDMVADYNYYARVFGDPDSLLGSDRDPEAIIVKMKKEGLSIPEIYMACGTEDFLLNENRRFHEFLVSEGVEHTYIESPGAHDWKFWNEHIEKGIEWSLFNENKLNKH